MTEEKIIIRSYSKAIFMLPTLILSIFGWIFQAIVKTPTPVLEIIWIIIFFVNIFVVFFDFSSSKFLIMILGIALTATIIYFTIFPVILNEDLFGDLTVKLGFTSHFYICMTSVLGFCLLIAVILPFFDYYTIERNELYHRKGIFTMAERWTLTNLRFTKEVPDIFEFMMYRAGTIKFYPTKTDVIILPTVLGINKKETQLDYILSKIKVDIE